MLRVAIQGGGCSGFEYALGFDRGAQAGDHELEFHGVKVVVDPFSAPYLRARRSTSSRRSRSPGSRSTTRTSPRRAGAARASRSPRAKRPTPPPAAAPAPTSSRRLRARHERVAAARRRRRLRPGRLLRGRRAAEERGPGRRGRPDRPAADAVGARPPRRRARPREHQGGLARVREDRARSPASASSATSRSVATSRTRSCSRSTTRSSTRSARRPTGGSGIPGEDLPGSWPATAFVAWYNGHPDFQELEFDLSHERAVVIGNGNVAIDCARMLALTAEELAPTDTTDAAIDAIVGSGIEEIVMLGRRGPVQAAFTPPELKELGELAGADVDRRPGRPRARPRERARARGRPRARSPQRRAPARVRRRARPRASRGASCCASSSRRSRSSATSASRRSRSSATSSSRRTAASSRARPARRELIPAGLVLRSVGYKGVAAARRAVRRVGAARSRTTAAASTAPSGPTPPAGSSAARAASSARTRRTRPRRSSCCSRTRAPGKLDVARAATSRRCSTSAASSYVEHVGLAGDRRRRARRRRAARPAAREAPHVGRLARRSAG